MDLHLAMHLGHHLKNAEESNASMKQSFKDTTGSSFDDRDGSTPTEETALRDSKFSSEGQRNFTDLY